MKKRINHSISGIFVFLLLGIFAVFGTVMVVLGARVYRDINEVSGVHSTARIGAAYLRSMIRGDDESGVLSIESMDGQDCIVMMNTYDDESYVTRIYVYDGVLREWFTEASVEFEPENGEEICRADAMRAEIQDGLMSIQLQTDGEWHEVKIALRTVKGAEQ